jgi:hypothetical protein
MAAFTQSISQIFLRRCPKSVVARKCWGDVQELAREKSPKAITTLNAAFEH